MSLIFYNNNVKNDDLNILTDIFISKNFEIKDFNVLEIIIKYKHSMENYEKIFNKKFADIFDDKIDVEHRINILKNYNLEIYDLEKIPIVIKDINDDGEFIFKWIGLKINKYSLCTSNINLRKIYRYLIDKSDQSIFYYDEIIKIFIEERICYHCFLKDLNTDLDDVFINELLSSVSNINNDNSH